MRPFADWLCSDESIRDIHDDCTSGGGRVAQPPNTR